MADLARLGIVVDSSQVSTADARLERLRRTGGRTESRLQRFGRTSTKVGRRLAVGLTAPLVAMGVASIKVASDFEASMTRINTLVGLSEERVGSMREEVLSLAGDTAVAPRELSQALFTVTSAGARGAEAMQILERSAKASAIGLGDTQQIARATTAVLQAYGKETVSASDATDILTGTVREGNLEASDLAPVLGRVIGIASQLGISFQEVGANIATFTRLGVGAEEAVTGLRGVMNSLLKPTRKGEQALAEVGMTFEDLRQSVADKGLAQTMIELVQAFEGNETALSQIIPNVRALSNVLGTAGAQTEAYDQILKNLNNTVGIVDEGFAKVSQTSAFQFKQTMAILEQTAIDVGSALLPLAKDVNAFVQDILASFNELSSEGKRTALLIAGLFGASGPVLIALGALSSAIGAISAPIAGIAVAVAGLATLIINNWSEIEEYFTTGGGSKMWGRLSATASKAFDVIKQAVDLFIDVVIDLWDNYGDWIVDKTETAFNTIFDVIDFYLGRVETTIKVWRQIAEGEFGQALDTIEEDFKVTWRSILRTTLDYFGEGGLISDPFSQWFTDTFVTKPLEALGLLEEEQKKTLDKLMIAPEPPEDIIIPAELPSAEELLEGVDLSLGEPLKLPVKAEIQGFDIDQLLRETGGGAQEFSQPFELLDQALLGLPVSIQQVDNALEELDESLLSAMTQAERDSIKSLIEDLQELRNQMTGAKDDSDEATEGLKQMDEITRSLGFTFSSAFEDAIIAGNNLRDVLQGLIDDIIRIILRTQAVKPLADALTGFIGGYIGGSSGGDQTSSARGNVFGGGRLIDSRETVSFANGGTGLFGEGASLEGVFPLTRLSNGDLGIKTEGGGGANVNVTVINNADGTEAQVEETRRPDGGRDISVMIDEVVSAKIRGGGKTAKAIRDTFGTQRKPRLRG